MALDRVRVQKKERKLLKDAWLAVERSSHFRPQMIAAENRLKSKEFDLVKTQGTLYQSTHFGASVFKRDDSDPSRFGFVVSTKVAAKSVQRNRIKRAIREGVRYNAKLAGIHKGFSIVFLAKKSIAPISTEEIMREVEYFLKNTNLA